MSEPKADAEILLNDGLSFAERMLSEYGEFHPFARALKADGDVIYISGFDGREFPPAEALIDLLADGLREQVQDEDYIATAIIFDALATPSGASEPCDAIAVELEHRSGYRAKVFVPYTIAEGQAQLGEPFASREARGIFPMVH